MNSTGWSSGRVAENCQRIRPSGRLTVSATREQPAEIFVPRLLPLRMVANLRRRPLACQPIGLVTHIRFQIDELAKQHLSPLVDVRWNLEATNVSLLLDRRCGILELALQICQFRNQQDRQVIDIAGSYLGGIVTVYVVAWNLQCQRLEPRVLQDGANPCNIC